MPPPSPAVRRVLLDAARLVERLMMGTNPETFAVHALDVLSGEDHSLFNQADDALYSALGGRTLAHSREEVVSALRDAAGKVKEEA